MHTISAMVDLALQGRGRRVRVGHPRGPPALGDPAAYPPSARGPRGHRAGDRVAGLRRAGGHGPGQRRAGPGNVRPRHRAAARAMASTSRRRPPTPSTSTSTTPRSPARPTCCARALRELATSGDLEALLRYQPHRGRPHDRAAVARHLRLRGLAVGADQVLIVNGSQHGLATTVMAALQAGDVVAVDALTYPGFKVLAHTLRLELAPLPATEGGPDLDALERLCAKPAGARRLRHADAAQPARLGDGRPRPRATGRDRAAVRAAHHRGRLLRLPGRERAAADRGPRAGHHRLRVRAVQERGHRAAGRLRLGPGATGYRDRARDPRDHLEHPGHHHRDRLPLARRRHRQPASRPASGTTPEPGSQSPATPSPACTLVGHPSSYFAWLPLRTGRSRRPDSGAPRPRAHLGCHSGAIRDVRARPSGAPAGPGLGRPRQPAPGAEPR